MDEYLARPSVVIDGVTPLVDCGRYPAKAIIGREFTVGADVFHHGHEILQAVLRYKGPGTEVWTEAPMRHHDDDREDRRIGSFCPDRLGCFAYTIEAWTDHWATWRRDIRLKSDDGQDVRVELAEGAALLVRLIDLVPGDDGAALQAAAATMAAGSEGPEVADLSNAAVQAGLDETLAGIIAAHPDRRGSTVLEPTLEVVVERVRAAEGAWYEFFPRSTGIDGRHGTFETAAKVLPDIAAMGFDVVYLPPIHPIGTAHRKGKNNALVAEDNDVGSPWAIGGEAGGHDAVHPDLGTIDEFDAFVASAEDLELDVAIDFAIQCSPDHPWVKEHPEWFHHRPDGSIKYAENPPKKYQDVYPLNFNCPNYTELWHELRRIVAFWISHGVTIFRVDNPHTKPLAFWEWMIGSIHADHPEAIFLAEAFTDAPMMKALSKLGFTQSYTYFTWKNTKEELTDYITELTRTEMAYYYRPNFFTNTPDILHEYLHHAGPPEFIARLVLAATLSPTYGIYSGFEFCESEPVEEGSEEYLDSEKYELRPRPIGRGGELTPLIRRLNEIRRGHDHFSELTNVDFHATDNENVIAYSKTSSHERGPILVAVNLEPATPQEATVTLDRRALAITSTTGLVATNLLTNEVLTWSPAQVLNFEASEPAYLLQLGN